MNRLNLQLAQKNVDVINRNYFVASKTATQTCTKNVFTNITFDTTPVIKGWTYNSTAGNFKCHEFGIYSINFTTLIASSSTNGEVASVRLALTRSSDAQQVANEVSGSSITKAFVNNSQWSNSILLKVNAGDIISLQFTGNGGTETISTASAIGGETPVLASLKVTLFAE